ncbi:MAG: pyruvate, phosphate dikinase [Candidatus Geothermarchaeales archaeon]
MKRWVYTFEEGGKEMRAQLGGKGANLAEMTKMGLRVPPGFIITTEACIEFFNNGGEFQPGLEEQIREGVRRLEAKTGKRFGGAENPLLLSVRSGAPISMPGMMDTVLNLGLNDQTVEALSKSTNDARFAYDAYRRFIIMFGDVVLSIERERFDEIFDEVKREEGVRRDADLSGDALRRIIEREKELIRSEVGRDLPTDPMEQLMMAVKAVFNSWNTRRAITYRELQGIPHNMGTACNIQVMVFGNLGWESCSGVLFTRNPATGEKSLYGELLFNAQGEDVVAGIRTPMSVADLREDHPELYRELSEAAERLEKHYRDMQDIEFTVERGTLYILQTRTGKRSAAASVKIAVDMAKEGIIDKREALMRVDPKQIEGMLHKQVDPKAKRRIIAKGLPASPGAAVGEVVFEPDEAEKRAKEGAKVILVRPETTPDDIHGIVAAQGVLTSRGGMTSHAAIVARGIGKPAVVGCEAVRLDLESRRFEADGVTVREGDVITFDGSTGEVMLGSIPLIEPKVGGEFGELLSWADEVREMGVYANADTEADVAKALEMGAEGIGLARTEHMFLGVERTKIVQDMILAETDDERRRALEKLLPLQVEDFKKILRIMDGRPVLIRLLDPPLHEFLPKAEALLVKIHELERQGADPQIIEAKKQLLKSVRRMQEANPMLGLRVCRLGIVYPEIYETQARAVFVAASELKEEGLDPRPEIMIPGSIHRNELTFLKELINRVAEEVRRVRGVRIDFKYGTMIEMPRAALTADEIAEVVDFFSFGTNDLTQTTLGLSRDDSQGTFLPLYIEKKVLEDDPFLTIDVKGVGKLIETAVRLGRGANKALEIGVCGEHGGEPRSINFFYEVGLDYVSCSPFRLPVARLAAAQAAIMKVERRAAAVRAA